MHAEIVHKETVPEEETTVPLDNRLLKRQETKMVKVPYNARNVT